MSLLISKYRWYSNAMQACQISMITLSDKSNKGHNNKSHSYQYQYHISKWVANTGIIFPIHRRPLHSRKSPFSYFLWEEMTDLKHYSWSGETYIMPKTHGMIFIIIALLALSTVNVDSEGNFFLLGYLIHRLLHKLVDYTSV